ncbi:MAG: hypothetical protein COA84_03475 [Robiginitomaculum sp.]|nr:MAG: hypothetical protein COA84_03475 [Robiginitomaculum sp.]
MTFGPWQFGTTEVIALIQTGAALCIAWWARGSVKEWIKQRATIRKSEVAEKTLALMYEADDVFKDIRSGLYFVPEGESQPTGAVKAKADCERGLDRIQKHYKFFGKVYSHFAITKALLGNNIYAQFKTVLRLRQEIYAAYVARQNYVVANEDEGTDPAKNLQHRYELWDIIYGASDDKDKFYQKYKTALKSLEDELLPMIRGA